MDGSTPLTNSRHERFACELAKGASQSEAYRLAGYEAGDANANASRLTANDSIQKRVLWLKKKAATGDILTMQEKREIAAQIARRGEKDSDRLAAIRVDNDLASDGAEANKQAMTIVVQIGGSDDADSGDSD